MIITQPQRILRCIYPIKSTCPHCGSEAYIDGGRSRHGLLRYRTCTGCRQTDTVAWRVKEVDTGGRNSDFLTF
jgi:hypothetical protein